jgi:hypothetical protein
MPVPTDADYMRSRDGCNRRTTVNGRRDDDQSVTLGELFRLITALKEEHGNKLDKIDLQVRITNGRTTALEEQMRAVKVDVRDLKPPTPSGVPVVTPEGESLSIKVSARMWAAIVAVGTALAVFVPMLADWFKSLGNK